MAPTHRRSAGWDGTGESRPCRSTTRRCAGYACTERVEGPSDLRGRATGLSTNRPTPPPASSSAPSARSFGRAELMPSSRLRRARHSSESASCGEWGRASMAEEAERDAPPPPQSRADHCHPAPSPTPGCDAAAWTDSRRRGITARARTSERGRRLGGGGLELTDGPPFAAAQELLVVLQAPDRALGACAERRATHAERTRTRCHRLEW